MTTLATGNLRYPTPVHFATERQGLCAGVRGRRRPDDYFRSRPESCVVRLARKALSHPFDGDPSTSTAIAIDDLRPDGGTRFVLCSSGTPAGLKQDATFGARDATVSCSCVVALKVFAL